MSDPLMASSTKVSESLQFEETFSRWRVFYDIYFIVKSSDPTIQHANLPGQIQQSSDKKCGQASSVEETPQQSCTPRGTSRPKGQLFGSADRDSKVK